MPRAAELLEEGRGTRLGMRPGRALAEEQPARAERADPLRHEPVPAHLLCLPCHGPQDPRSLRGVHGRRETDRADVVPRVRLGRGDPFRRCPAGCNRGSHCCRAPCDEPPGAVPLPAGDPVGKGVREQVPHALLVSRCPPRSLPRLPCAGSVRSRAARPPSRSPCRRLPREASRGAGESPGQRGCPSRPSRQGEPRTPRRGSPCPCRSLQGRARPAGRKPQPGDAPAQRRGTCLVHEPEHPQHLSRLVPRGLGRGVQPRQLTGSRAPHSAHSSTSPARSERRISGSGCASSLSDSLQKRRHVPGPSLPALPRRWSAEDWLSRSVTSLSRPVDG